MATTVPPDAARLTRPASETPAASAARNIPPAEQRLQRKITKVQAHQMDDKLRSAIVSLDSIPNLNLLDSKCSIRSSVESHILSVDAALVAAFSEVDSQLRELTSSVDNLASCVSAVSTAVRGSHDDVNQLVAKALLLSHDLADVKQRAQHAAAFVAAHNIAQSDRDALIDGPVGSSFFSALERVRDTYTAATTSTDPVSAAVDQTTRAELRELAYTYMTKAYERLFQHCTRVALKAFGDEAAEPPSVVLRALGVLAARPVLWGQVVGMVGGVRRAAAARRYEFDIAAHFGTAGGGGSAAPSHGRGVAAAVARGDGPLRVASDVLAVAHVIVAEETELAATLYPGIPEVSSKAARAGPAAAAAAAAAADSRRRRGDADDVVVVAPLPRESALEYEPADYVTEVLDGVTAALKVDLDAIVAVGGALPASSPTQTTTDHHGAASADRPSSVDAAAAADGVRVRLAVVGTLLRLGGLVAFYEETIRGLLPVPMAAGGAAADAAAGVRPNGAGGADAGGGGRRLTMAAALENVTAAVWARADAAADATVDAVVTARPTDAPAIVIAAADALRHLVVEVAEGVGGAASVAAGRAVAAVADAAVAAVRPLLTEWRAAAAAGRPGPLSAAAAVVVALDAVAAVAALAEGVPDAAIDGLTDAADAAAVQLRASAVAAAISASGLSAMENPTAAAALSPSEVKGILASFHQFLYRVSGPVVQLPPDMSAIRAREVNRATRDAIRGAYERLYNAHSGGELAAEFPHEVAEVDTLLDVA